MQTVPFRWSRVWMAMAVGGVLGRDWQVKAFWELRRRAQ